MDIPVYEEAASSPLTQVLKEKGFLGWHKFSNGADFAFYKLLACGLTHHFNSSFPFAEYLNKKWFERLPQLRAFCGTGLGKEQFSTPQLWNTLGQNLIADLRLAFGTKPWFREMASGKVIDKNLRDVYVSFLSHIGVSLIWYECRSNGQVRANTYISATAKDPQVYVAMATEGDMLYLLFHSAFSSSEYKEGFPFYTTGAADPNIPSIESYSASQSSSEASSFCLQQQSQIITLLTQLMCKCTPFPLPPSAASEQTQLKLLLSNVNQLIRTSSLPIPPLESPEIEQIIYIQKEAIAENMDAKPSFHDCSNCEKWPEYGACDVNHLGEQFHSQCLRMYVLQLQDPKSEIPCPRCQHPLPDPLVEIVAPEIIAEKKRLQNDIYTKKKGFTYAVQYGGNADFPSPGSNMGQVSAYPAYNSSRQLPTPPPAASGSPCPQCNAGIVMQWFYYDCGNAVCALCASRNRSSYANCPFCHQPLSSSEENRLADAYSKSFSG